VWTPSMMASIHPFVTYGIGLYRVSVKTDGFDPAFGANDTESENKFGFNVGLGADFKSTQSMKWGAQVKYHYVTDAVSTTDLSTGIETTSAATYLTAGIHVTFNTSGVTSSPSHTK